METMRGGIALFLLIEFAAGATWSNCFNEDEVSKIFDECVTRSTRDLSRISYDQAAKEDERFDYTLLTEERPYRKIRSSSNLISKRSISERHFFQGLFPVGRNYQRELCRKEFLVGTTVFATINSDVIKDNLGRVAKPGKLTDIQKTVDECRKIYDAAWGFWVTQYQKCFMRLMETVCRTSSPDPNTNARTNSPPIN